jgi:hypothetical protein
MRLPISLIAGSLGLLAGCAATNATTEPQAISQLGRGTDVLIIGEIHGTAETPRAFGGLVEQAARGRRIAVGLEMTEATIAEAACEHRRPPDGSVWLRPLQDGRTSQAMRALVCRLKLLRDRGRISLFGFAPASASEVGNPRYAAAIQARARSGGTPMMLLIGNYHGRRVPGGLVQALGDSGLKVVSVTVSSPGGTAFTCGRNGECGPSPSTARFCSIEASAPTLLVGAPAGLPAELPWDGCLILPPTTASPPV